MAKQVCHQCGATLSARAISLSGVCDACGTAVAEVTGFLSFEEDPPVELVAFDVETTGLYADSAGITEIGAVRFRSDGSILDTFVSLTNPGYRIPRNVTEITGISDAMILDAPPTSRVLRKWLEWLGPDPVLVAHNASFDMQFIHTVLPEAEFQVIDTLTWARECALPVRDHKLETLLNHIGYSSPHFHRAEADARGVVALCSFLLARDGAAADALPLRERVSQRCQDSRQLCLRAGRRSGKG